MNYRRLGSSDLQLSELSFGSWATHGKPLGLPVNAWPPLTMRVSTFLITPRSMLHVRSASRLGYGDYGVSRKRVEAMCRAFAGHNL